MAGSSGGSKGGKKTARIEIIPLIDVIFFLLATFVLFTLSLNKSNGLPGVVVPLSETGIARETAGTHTVSITAESTIAWDKDPVAADEFITRLRIFHQENPDGRILINGDENASFGSVFGYVVDEVRKSGATRVFIETHVKPQGK